MQFLDWFVKEQGEEEKNADNLVKRFELFGHDPKGLYMLDSASTAALPASAEPTPGSMADVSPHGTRFTQIGRAHV